MICFSDTKLAWAWLGSLGWLQGSSCLYLYRLNYRPFKLDKEKQQTFTKHFVTKIAKMQSKINDIFLSNFATKLSNFSKIDFEPEDVTERGCEEEEGKGMEGQRFLKPTIPESILPNFFSL